MSATVKAATGLRRRWRRAERRYGILFKNCEETTLHSLQLVLLVRSETYTFQSESGYTGRVWVLGENKWLDDWKFHWKVRRRTKSAPSGTNLTKLSLAKIFSQFNSPKSDRAVMHTYITWDSVTVYSSERANSYQTMHVQHEYTENIVHGAIRYNSTWLWWVRLQ